jgi:4'-phosphopantetheinyl transferase
MPIQFQINNPRNKILVWYLTESEQELQEKVQISENEIFKLSKISVLQMRCSFLCIRIMVKNLGLSEIKYLKNGKPTLDDGFITISHSGSWVGILYSKENEVGIDVEKINSRILKIKDRFLTQHEQLEVCNNQVEKMVLCWSAKEALFKKHGGETVFFRENMEITKIDFENKLIDTRIRLKDGFKNETLSFFHLDSDYVLVNTI